MIHLSEAAQEIFGAHDSTLSVTDLIELLKNLEHADDLITSVTAEYLPDTLGYPAGFEDDEEAIGETEEPIEGAPHPADSFEPAPEPAPVKERKKRTTKTKI